MHLFFADDSTQKGAREGMGKLVAFGGLLFPADRIREHTAAINAICKEEGLPDGTELKWSPARENWMWDNCKEGARERLYKRVLEATAAAGARGVVTVWDTGRTSLEGAAAFDKAVEYTFERVTIRLTQLNSHAVFIADRPGGGKDEDSEFLEHFVQRAESGTEYVGGDRLLLNCLTTPSHLVRQLQVADLVVGVTTAMVAGKYTYAKPLFAKIKPMLFENAMNGIIGGTGLKLVPDALTNLHLHVLGEDAYYRGFSGVSLPWSNFPYQTDEK
jgi:hypothetical protein